MYINFDSEKAHWKNLTSKPLSMPRRETSAASFSTSTTETESNSAVRHASDSPSPFVLTYSSPVAFDEEARSTTTCLRPSSIISLSLVLRFELTFMIVRRFRPGSIVEVSNEDPDGDGDRDKGVEAPGIRSLLIKVKAYSARKIRTRRSCTVGVFNS